MNGVSQGLDRNIVRTRARGVYAPPAVRQIDQLETTRARIVASGHGSLSLLSDASRFVCGCGERSS